MTEVFAIKQATWVSQKGGECVPVVVTTIRKSDETAEEFCDRHAARVEAKADKCKPKTPIVDGEYYVEPL